ELKQLERRLERSFTRTRSKKAIPPPFQKKLAFYTRALEAKHLEIKQIIAEFVKLNNSTIDALSSLRQEYIKCSEELSSMLSLYFRTERELRDTREGLEQTRASLEQTKEILQAYKDRVLTLEEENKTLRMLRRCSNLGT
ncbi:uncharacterized protein LOC110035021, partial [Phalaenopsis equestris]|uniref:uncharacterized protein LOC110035021 n=1 Tax=Phalaenopsis equestris TaxID=78828 RepID=UPI0009E329BC